jgi:hypothetical protein
MMLRWSRFAAIALFAAATLSLTAAPASAFTKELLQPGGNTGATLADPDNQLTSSGQGQGQDQSQGMKPLGQNGPVVQFGVQQGPVGSFGRFEGSGFNAPPPSDPYYGGLNNRN